MKGVRLSKALEHYLGKTPVNPDRGKFHQESEVAFVQILIAFITSPLLLTLFEKICATLLTPYGRCRIH